MLDPQVATPPTATVFKVGAESVPNTEAPFVTVWGSDGTRELRATMLATAAEAEAVMFACGVVTDGK